MIVKYVTAVVLCGVCYSLSSANNSELNFDSFVYTQTQPETLCLKTIASGEKCAIPQNVTTWTVHGLWPTKNGTKGPYNCNVSAKFDPTKLRGIEANLWKFWPNLFPSSGGDIYEFWEHEWYKHGTCALKLAATSNEYLYFNTALKLQGKVNLDKILSDAGLPPSDDLTYPLEIVTAAINNAVGKKVIIECYIRDKKQYIWQVEVCMDTQFRVIDCSSTTGGGCSSKYQVIYPVIKHPYQNRTYNSYIMLKQV